VKNFKVKGNNLAMSVFNLSQSVLIPLEFFCAQHNHASTNKQKKTRVLISFYVK